MRFRPLVALSAAAVSVVLFAGCTGSPQPTDTTDTASPSAGELCDAKLPSGAASDAVTADGAVGEAPKVTFSAPLEIEGIQSSVLVEGDGDEVAEGDFAHVAFVGVDAETATELGAVGYAEAEILPQQIGAGTGLGQFLGCATVGTRVAVTLPADQASGTGAQVYVLDLLDVAPGAAWGDEQEPVDGMPAVELADDGAPTVTIPEATAPTDLQISVLKKGDGPAVAAGDTTLLHYYGVDWETGESFDSSWSRGAPYSIPGNQFVEGFVQALAGQPVGSQVLVVIPPALGYGEAGSSDHELAGKTLVFVIDILATQHAPAA
ncbi:MULTISPECIES: FKBP-type peptidyl-prolyl cis-trans isomerase [unclassified Microbacterium]|uniref:FKBP-type peptidyl-prolyl cis-trans isomerase n=1 Tax=unclassified Microbacterium TaxID=2609290 RepID=UPI00214D05A5|nr:MULTISPECIES: FKBP-type peptidyl-prolyl cis-trans isomerase [unclassified Microbacterium]MCR2785355.1 FKBP-type peptidyl-prolyl cis-trans isomerase [Microbacterium sp. zg.B96]WIM16881.1 FKBP-type peptidyl-prolyl cis-trans isomerase [Microbacterium sp. zg-B96]